MLSVCIPLYNFDVRGLVAELDRQADRLQHPLEILVYDDRSSDRYRALNREIDCIERVRYVLQPENLGRASLRNLMATEANGDTLIMLDADSEPNPSYLSNYLASPELKVVVGGTSYTKRPPLDPSLRLHWHYGRKRESISLARRRPRPYLHFQSNNFRVHRQFFLQHPFPKVHSYGHEDTLWGQLLAPAGTKITYIDNPVTHLGLQTAERFLVRQRQAVDTLKLLRRQYPTLTTRLTKFADRNPMLAQMAEVFPERLLIRYLLRTHNLRALDMLKLKWWITGWALAIGYQ